MTANIIGVTLTSLIKVLFLHSFFFKALKCHQNPAGSRIFTALTYYLAYLPADIYPNRGQNRANALDIATNLAASLITAFPDAFSGESSHRIVKNVSNIWRDRDKVIRISAMATGNEETDTDNTQTWMKAHTLTAA